MVDGPAAAVSTAIVEVTLTADPTVSLCLQQNAVPPIKHIRLRNVGSESYRDITVHVWAEPAFASPLTLQLALLKPGEQRTLDEVDLLLAPEYLVAQNEAARGLIHVRVEAGGHVLGALSKPVDVLAYDQWGGARSVVELLAAFVLPNHPSIEQVLAEASELLRTSGLSDAWDGYARGSRNAVQHMVGAIYETLRRKGISYILPPASFEETGQKIRTPERILRSSLGTCLDLALLLAGCLEQAGLHPLIVLRKGHAFVAVWLEDRMLSTVADDDGVNLRKRVDAGEMLAIETTLLTGVQSQPFPKALTQGRQQLDSDDKFHCVIDIARARKARIRPLQGRIVGGNELRPIAHLAMVAPQGGLPAVQPVREAPAPAAPVSTRETRLDRWRRRLLDLTMHNRLLNFRPGAKTLPILCADLGRLEDLLAEGAKFQLRERPQEFGATDARDAAAYRRMSGDDAAVGVLREALAGRRLHVDLDRPTLDRRALEIFREARLAQEESGTSALFCAIGFLTWYQTDEADKPRKAPLLLLPVNLVRGSIDQGFKLEAGDDEPRINESLLEMLEQDFELTVPGLKPLPTDEHGVDVPRVFELFRAAIADCKRWEVTQEVHVGFFSFSKFLMWRDLQEHADALLENSVVRHLVQNRNQDFDPGGPIPRPERLDQERAAATTFCPVSADSSQLAAVFAAADGRSFVLEGPPGTGKSQTITNMIAQCMALGKTVLFVAEKNVALEVVHERLEASGLGEHCLELHSNKAKKADVMRQLERAMSRAPAAESPEWTRTSTQLEQQRAKLNAYVAALHQPRSTGESAYRGLTRLIGLAGRPLIRVDFGSLRSMTEERVAGLRERTQRLATVARGVESPRAHPWRFVTRAGWDPLWQGKVEESVSDTLQALRDVQLSISPAARVLGLDASTITYQQMSAAATACEVLIDPPYVPSGMLLAGDWPQLQHGLTGLWQAGRKRDAVRELVRQVFSEAVLQADLEGLAHRLRQAANAWAPIRWIRRLLARRALRPMLLPGAQIKLDALDQSVEQAAAFKQVQTQLASLAGAVSSALGALYADGEGRWSDMERATAWVSTARAAAMRAANDDVGQALALRQRWAALVAEAPESLSRSAPNGQALTRFAQAVAVLYERLGKLEQVLEMQPGALVEATRGQPERMSAQLQELIAALPRLRAWCQWVEARQECVSQGLGALVAAFEEDKVAAADLVPTMEKAYYQWFTEHVVNEDPVLRGFHSGEQTRLIEEFAQTDTSQQQLTSEAIRARVRQRAPVTDAAAAKTSAVGILRRETQKRARHMPVRALLGETGDVVMRLTPCFLMSPISVAQYLDPRMPKFDVVIFDEASQIPAWEAVGAIARGRTAVIVGDPKQLPPTSFFGRAEQEGEADAELDDLESILDDCIGGGLPWLCLRWHYRSRHESLITFSNHHYYDGKLITLPSADTDAATDRGVSFRYIADGVYDKGKSRTNKREAEAVVAEVTKRLLRPGASNSIGIVTFNTEQRDLIEDLLDAARRTHPQIEAHFAEGREAGVFVKNLENVQGDERDVILFSIGYGPDSEGRVSMNFGPMNRDGGHRRLNVAITRARCEVVVFSSLRADQLDLTRTQARGVHDLRAFLDFAERGVRALREANRVIADAEFDSPFEEDVCDRLRRLGWQVVPQVGCSGYRIDLGVVDPDKPGRFLMGVECDGAAYHSAASARDRDKLRASVLSGLGWKLYRIWSTDYWQDANGEMQRLHDALTRELAAARERRKAGESERPAAPVPAKLVQAPPVAVPKPIQAPAPAPVAAAKRAAGLRYVLADLGVRGQPEAFYLPETTHVIRDAVHHVIQHEGPISFNLLSRRVGDAWAFGRVTTQAQERVRALIGSRILRESDGELLFLWPEGKEPRSYQEFRVPHGTNGQRDALDLPLAEVRNAALHWLQSSGGAPLDDIAREIARLFGFQRMGARVAARMNAGVLALVEVGWAEQRGGRVIPLR